MKIDASRSIETAQRSTRHVPLWDVKKGKALLIAARGFTFHQAGATSPCQTTATLRDNDDYYHGDVDETMSPRGRAGSGGGGSSINPRGG